LPLLELVLLLVVAVVMIGVSRVIGMNAALNLSQGHIQSVLSPLTKTETIIQTMISIHLMGLT